VASAHDFYGVNMLSFEVVNSRNAIQIYLDHEGLNNLIAILENMRKGQTTGHIHLRSIQNPGGKEGALSSKTPWGKDAMSEVIITMGGDDA